MAISSGIDKAFKLGNMADDLLCLTLDLCGRDDNHNPRFPLMFYPSLVTQIVNVTLEIQQSVILANEEYFGVERLNAQKKTAARCKLLNHLIRVMKERGYISDKQRDRWQSLVTSIYWACKRWITSDTKRCQ